MARALRSSLAWPDFAQIHFLLLFSRQGKVRLSKYYSTFTQKDRNKIIKEATTQVLVRGSKLCNFVEWREYKLVYRRYASLFFCVGCDPGDNELATLETIHQFVETLDKYFGNVCELDLIFNFHKAYYILDEVLVGGELQEPSKKLIGRLVAEADALADVDTPEGER